MKLECFKWMKRTIKLSFTVYLLLLTWMSLFLLTSCATTEEQQITIYIDSDVTFKEQLAAKGQPEYAVLKYRTMGKGDYSEISLNHKARGAYMVQLPESNGEGLEYFIEVKLASGNLIKWPATAPEINQTIIFL